MFNLNEHIPCDPLMAIAWRDCLMWAVGEEEILTAFREETYFHWKPAITAIDHMVDEAYGMDKKFFELFLSWFNENIWGDLTITAGPAATNPEAKP